MNQIASFTSRDFYRFFNEVELGILGKHFIKLISESNNVNYFNNSSLKLFLPQSSMKAHMKAFIVNNEAIIKAIKF